MGTRYTTIVHSAFAGVGRLLERGVDLELILGTLVDAAAEALKAERGTLYLVDRARRQIFSKAAHLPELAEIRLDFGQGVAGSVAATGRTARLHAPSGCVRLAHWPAAAGRRTDLCARPADSPGAPYFRRLK